MNRPEWVKEMIEKKTPKEEILKRLIEGNGMVGIKAINGKDDNQKMQFAKLIYGRIEKKLK